MTTLAYYGRLNRAPYIIWTILIGFMVSILNLSWIMGLLNIRIALIFELALILFFSIITVKRLHDIGRPGWYFWTLYFIPLYNLYLFILLIGQKGTTGSNLYGLDPLLAESSDNKHNVL